MHAGACHGSALLFFFTLVTGPGGSLSLKLRDTRVYEPQIRAPLGTTAHLCEVVVLKLREGVRQPIYDYATTTVSSGRVFIMNTISHRELEPFLHELGERLQCPGEESYS